MAAATLHWEERKSIIRDAEQQKEGIPGRLEQKREEEKKRKERISVWVWWAAAFHLAHPILDS